MQLAAQTGRQAKREHITNFPPEPAPFNAKGISPTAPGRAGDHNERRFIFNRKRFEMRTRFTAQP
jgi:hypothetical protein